jgi:hypothetical protein
MSSWRPLPREGSPRMTSVEVEKRMKEEPDRLLLKLFGLVLDLGTEANAKNGFQKFLASMRGKDASNWLESVLYFPGLNAEQSRLFLEDQVQFEMKLDVKVIAMLVDEKL